MNDQMPACQRSQMSYCASKSRALIDPDMNSRGAGGLGCLVADEVSGQPPEAVGEDDEEHERGLAIVAAHRWARSLGDRWRRGVPRRVVPTRLGSEAGMNVLLLLRFGGFPVEA